MASDPPVQAWLAPGSRRLLLQGHELRLEVDWGKKVFIKVGREGGSRRGVQDECGRGPVP